MTKRIDFLGSHISYVLDCNSGYYRLVQTKRANPDFIELPREFKITDSMFKSQDDEDLLILEGNERSRWGTAYFRNALQQVLKGLLVFAIKGSSDLNRYDTYSGFLLAMSDDKVTVWVYRLGNTHSKSYGDAIKEFSGVVKKRYSRV